MDGDNDSMATISMDESKWRDLDPILDLNDSASHLFNGIGWFRLHFIADTSIINRPLGLGVSHYGASEIYLDGNLIKSFGLIANKENCIYYNPNYLRFMFTIAKAGEHVFAIRYANFNAEKNYKIFNSTRQGFTLTIGESDLSHFEKGIIVYSSQTMLVFGFFFAFSLLHLLMYLFYKIDKANLFFSILMFSVPMIFLTDFIADTTHAPDISMICNYLITPITCFAFLTLSLFINELYSKERGVRFWILNSVGIVTIILWLLSISIFNYFMIFLIAFVVIEAIILIVTAVIKKIKGARIIGGGILFSSICLLILLTIAIRNDDFGVLNGKMYINVPTLTLELIYFLSILSIPASMSAHQAWKFSMVSRDLSLQLVQVKALSEKTIQQEQEKKRMLESRKEELEKEVEIRTEEIVRQKNEIEREKEKSDDLLLNILPAEVMEELKQTGKTRARNYDLVTVLFADFKDFTQKAEDVSPEELVLAIDNYFETFDKIIGKYTIEKIKTVGDAYICAAGLPQISNNNPIIMMDAAFEMVHAIEQLKQNRQKAGKIYFDVRIGAHSGPLVAGVVGIKKFAFDIWGDTVNTAARMQQYGEPGKINVSGATYELIKHRFKCLHRGKIEVKHKGEVDMYLVEDKK